MFIRAIHKVNKNTGLTSTQYRLCESYRFGDQVRQSTILHLGALEAFPDVEQKRLLGVRIYELVKENHTGIKSLFVPDELIEKQAQYFFNQILEKRRLDIAAGKDLQRIATESIRHKEVREIGAENLSFQALQQLKVADFLRGAGWSEPELQLALTHIVSRAVYPASELRTSDWIRQNSAVCTLTGYPIEKITKDKLYGISKALYSLKSELEQHLSKRTNELFDLEDKLIIYDLTNTYFEGSMRSSSLAKFGRSKEKRSDAKLVVLAVVINREGFLKYSQIFEGNMSDSTSLQKIITDLSARTSGTERKPVVVMDAGIATEENLELLKAQGFDYMCVSRSGMKKYRVDAAQQPIVVRDKKDRPIELRKAKVEGSTDNWLQVYSETKGLKEAGMNSRFSQKFEEGLSQIQSGLIKKGGTKKADKVWERIGRLKQKYPSIHRHYDIKATTGGNDNIITAITWSQKKVEGGKKSGYYLLRTTLDESKEAVQWQIYNTIREVESTMRSLKSDLDLRPVYHKTDEAAMAHLHLGMLAYWVVNTVRYQLKQKGIHNEWRDIVRIMNTQKMVTTKMEDEYDQTIILKKCSEPIEDVTKIYEALKYKPQPFTRKKFVVPPAEIEKNETIENRGIRSG